MSFVTDYVRHVDGQLDRLRLDKARVRQADSDNASDAVARRGRTEELQAAIKALSALSSSQVIPSRYALAALLEGALLDDDERASSHTADEELQWLLVGKGTAQAYGLVLNTFLDQIISLSDDVQYWKEVLGSPHYIGLYTLQTSPTRLWHWSVDIYQDARQRLQLLRERDDQPGTVNQQRNTTAPLLDQWHQFYGIVRQSIRDRSLADVRSKLMTPFSKGQAEVKSSLKHVQRLRELHASALGILVDEGMLFETGDSSSVSSPLSSQRLEEGDDGWKATIGRSIALLGSVVDSVTTVKSGPRKFEELVLKSEHNLATQDQPKRLAQQLLETLNRRLPTHATAFDALASQYGKPSWLVRYWIRGAILALFSTTTLRIFISRRAEIVRWMQDLGTTTVDFWHNWIVDPVKKIIGTIRHDKDSEIAIMSKDSLRGDQASLERMVVEFASDNADPATGQRRTESELADVRAKVREGDLTPVLRAYEKDLRRPFVGTIRGELVRALLIQVQKTKVDVEVAVSGIDNLLRSQELVFGFVGLTPSILICFAVGRWLGGRVASKRLRFLRGQSSDGGGGVLRPLRNIDRILSSASSSSSTATSSPQEHGDDMLSYSEHGLLLCEVHTLRSRATKILPSSVKNDFFEDVHELADLRAGVERQKRVVDRIRWAYGAWLTA